MTTNSPSDVSLLAPPGEIQWQGKLLLPVGVGNTASGHPEALQTVGALCGQMLCGAAQAANTLELWPLRSVSCKWTWPRDPEVLAIIRNNGILL